MSVRRSAGGVWIEKRKKKDMSLILCIETGTDICSVGLARDGELISLRESDQGRDHARQVGVFVDELLSQTGIAPEELDAAVAGGGKAGHHADERCLSGSVRSYNGNVFSCQEIKGDRLCQTNKRVAYYAPRYVYCMLLHHPIIIYT